MWMNSASHKDNILCEDFQYGAVSLFQCDDLVYVALEFGY